MSVDTAVGPAEPLLSVEDLSITFVQYEAGLRRRRLDVVTGLDLQVAAGELVSVVGASGSGKSLLAHALLGLLPSNAVEGGRSATTARRWMPLGAAGCGAARSP